ncbi:MAG TPA: hypothetical protein VE684_16875, partial [Crenalkalicoccus sp.]|nr:hypothetical protein [Crenalkalicoccus sp.]
MRILLASTPAPGHLNPILAIGRILIAEGHEVIVLSGTKFRGRVEGIGAGFRALPPGADLDTQSGAGVIPEAKCIPPGPEWLRVVMERFCVDTIPAQHAGLRHALTEFTADVVIGDDIFFGILPMLLGPRSERPPVVLCGTSILHWRRADRAPNFAGLPPAASAA